MELNREFWTSRKVLITGHTGFKGAWLALWLEALGAEVSGLSLDPTPGSLGALLGPDLPGRSEQVDVRDYDRVTEKFAQAGPDLVFHLAAQALVRQGYQDPIGTFETNVMGTLSVLQAASLSSTAPAVVVVTSDKVYRLDERRGGYAEGDALGGVDPYSASKAAAEMATAAWRVTHPMTRIATARAGNVIGGGDNAPERLIPDVIAALASNVPVRLRMPNATRPWQYVLEPIMGYLMLAEALYQRDATVPPAINFGPHAGRATVLEVVTAFLDQWGHGSWEVAANSSWVEASDLAVDPTLAQETLAWSPVLSLSEAIEMTVDWYRSVSAGLNPRRVCEDQIRSFEQKANERIGNIV